MTVFHRILSYTFFLCFISPFTFGQGFIEFYGQALTKSKLDSILKTTSSKKVNINVYSKEINLQTFNSKIKDTLDLAENTTLWCKNQDAQINVQGLVIKNNLSIFSHLVSNDFDFDKNRNFEINYETFFENCEVFGELRLDEYSHSLTFSNCVFHNDIRISENKGQININNSRFLGSLAIDAFIKTLTIDGCNFICAEGIADTIKDNKGLFSRIGGVFNSIVVRNCKIDQLVFFTGEIKNSFELNLSGNPKLDFSGLTFPSDPFQVRIPFINYQTDPLVFYFLGEEYLDTFKGIFKRDRYLFHTEMDSSNERFNVLASCYNKLLNIYKYNGDDRSYKRLYVFYKRLCNKRLLAELKKEHQFELTFEYYFNRFLEFYCDYGTNPVKALIYSFYLVLIFAGLFILFPSEPDNLQRHFFIEKIGKYLSYFSSDSHLADLKRKEYEQELAELEDFRLNLEDTIKKAPSIIPWISKPYYRISMMYFNIHLWLLEKVDFARLSWNRMSKNQRIKASLIMTVYMFGFIFWGVVVRVMNGLALSMNAFITLGYGEITAKGIARYLAVVEGCMGWFLLSIFSVSLIAQMMQ